MEYEIYVSGLSNPIKLVERCWLCYNEDEPNKNCRSCKGKGYCLTDNGKTILDFVKNCQDLT